MSGDLRARGDEAVDGATNREAVVRKEGEAEV